MKALILAGLLAGAVHSYADGNLILTCLGQLTKETDLVATLGKKIKLEISQTPEREDYRWFLRITGDVTLEERTNGPINADGTSVAPSGEENQVMHQGLAGGILLKAGGIGILNHIQDIPTQSGRVEYQLMEYGLFECTRTGVTIDLREATIYNAKSELADLALLHGSPWLVGVGVRIGNSGEALGLGLYATDETQRDAFIAEFQKRGLVSVNPAGEVHYRGVRAEFEMVGEVEPIP